MPKIIENLQDRLMDEAKKQVQQLGYGAVTIRSIAAGCGVGVGTVYNYFPSKEALIATFLLEDWRGCVTAMENAAHTDAPEQAARCIYDQLRSFADRHGSIFRDETAAAGFAGSFSQYHGILRDQLAKPLRPFCPSDFAAQFVAESLLTWTIHGKEFEEIYGMIRQIMKGENHHVQL